MTMSSYFDFSQFCQFPEIHEKLFSNTFMNIFAKKVIIKSQWQCEVTLILTESDVKSKLYQHQSWIYHIILNWIQNLKNFGHRQKFTYNFDYIFNLTFGKESLLIFDKNNDSFFDFFTIIQCFFLYFRNQNLLSKYSGPLILWL